MADLMERKTKTGGARSTSTGNRKASPGQGTVPRRLSREEAERLLYDESVGPDPNVSWFQILLGRVPRRPDDLSSGIPRRKSWLGRLISGSG